VRPRMTRLVVALTFAGILAGGSLARAHHSFAAIYVDDQTATIEGVVVQFLYRNPHSILQVSVKQRNGGEVRYEVEWKGAAQLMQQGVTRMTVAVGDQLIISGSPSRNPLDRWLRMISLRRPRDGFTWREPRDQGDN
jgi:hypothetical protein